MSEQKYTDEQFMAAIRKAVGIRGEDYVYPSKEEHPEYWLNTYLDNTDSSDNLSCRYRLKDGTPACIVGLALHEIDPALVPASSQVANASIILRDIGFSPEVRRPARAAQSAQDGGASWGEALRVFEACYAAEVDGKVNAS